ncbi:hypothetical protein cyc_03504 [Cyclospora cayetanensis]|uniref:Uncharacterized protein n=1 Tax=Cyclospora cayetanensis TaxID=88456 RepID=A0A1D3CRT1_9EIME|nr:hypothetical protein cyc_03504 [Cyclospora cayetanensis]
MRLPPDGIGGAAGLWGPHDLPMRSSKAAGAPLILLSPPPFAVWGPPSAPTCEGPYPGRRRSCLDAEFPGRLPINPPPEILKNTLSSTALQGQEAPSDGQPRLRSSNCHSLRGTFERDRWTKASSEQKASHGSSASREGYNGGGKNGLSFLRFPDGCPPCWEGGHTRLPTTTQGAPPPCADIGQYLFSLALRLRTECRHGRHPRESILLSKKGPPTSTPPGSRRRLARGLPLGWGQSQHRQQSSQEQQQSEP